MPLNGWLANIQDWLLPRLCPGCGLACGPGRDLCPGCDAALPVIRSACPRCAQPYEHPAARGHCGACLRRPPAHARGLALYRYAPPVDHFIRALKFHHGLGLARLLGERLAQRLHSETSRPDRIIPVPLHLGRLRARGYNQALEIARPIARALDITLDSDSLIRTRPTAAQSDLPIEARRRNVRGAFAVRESALSGLRIALVDDVMTTGSTVEAASQTLLRAGAAEVEIWVVARA